MSLEEQLTTNTLNKSQLIIAIKYLEILGESGFSPVGLQQAMRQTVKCTNPQTMRWPPKHFFNPAPHLPSGLVGKGHGHYGVR